MSGIVVKEHCGARIPAILFIALLIFLSFGAAARAQGNPAGVHEGVTVIGNFGSHAARMRQGQSGVDMVMTEK